MSELTLKCGGGCSLQTWSAEPGSCVLSWHRCQSAASGKMAPLYDGCSSAAVQAIGSVSSFRQYIHCRLPLRRCALKCPFCTSAGREPRLTDLAVHTDCRPLISYPARSARLGMYSSKPSTAKSAGAGQQQAETLEPIISIVEAGSPVRSLPGAWSSCCLSGSAAGGSTAISPLLWVC